MADVELRKAFTEMHINKIETTKQVKLIDFRTDVLKNTKQKFFLTDKGISDLQNDSRVYQSIGRMFALTNVPQVREDLIANQEKCESAIKQLTEKKSFLVKNLQEQEDALRDLVKQKKDSDTK
ncbi:hypothetical protein ACFFRR_005330 [Megaselia abdita]